MLHGLCEEVRNPALSEGRSWPTACSRQISADPTRGLAARTVLPNWPKFGRAGLASASSYRTLPGLPRAVKCRQVLGLEQQAFTVSRLWRLQVQSQCPGRAVLPLKPAGEGSALASLQLPGLGGNLGRSAARRLVTPILPLSYTSLSLSKFSLFIRIRTHRKHLILT